ncbi:hypothetical protein TrCOL_g7946 [Triparma columacea]|uniref:Uncharacterized protein n=1 Tax=Triparma columacea TaxID=722753 RepID=A0A9W7G973_9STRA|nr:hypothetical protein TrCOL_g7946 [Triparma columacea]
MTTSVGTFNAQGFQWEGIHYGLRPGYQLKSIVAISKSSLSNPTTSDAPPSDSEEPSKSKKRRRKNSGDAISSSSSSPPPTPNTTLSSSGILMYGVVKFAGHLFSFSSCSSLTFTISLRNNRITNNSHDPTTGSERFKMVESTDVWKILDGTVMWNESGWSEEDVRTDGKWRLLEVQGGEWGLDDGEKGSRKSEWLGTGVKIIGKVGTAGKVEWRGDEEVGGGKKKQGKGRKRKTDEEHEQGEGMMDEQSKFKTSLEGPYVPGSTLPRNVHTGALSRIGIYKYFKSMYTSEEQPSGKQVRDAVNTWLVTPSAAAAIVKAAVRYGKTTDVRSNVNSVLERAQVGDGGGVRGNVEGFWTAGEGKVVLECLVGKVGGEGYAVMWIKGCMGLGIERGVWEGVRERVRRERSGRDGEGWEWGKGERVYKRNEIVLW